MPDLSNRKLVLIGGGGHCASVCDTLRKCGIYDEIVITDKELPEGSISCGCTVAGTDDKLPELFAKGYTDAVITVGSINDDSVRRKIADGADGIGFSVPIIMDPSASVAEDAVVSDGVFVGKQAVINAGSRIGRFAIINTSAVVEHNCSIGDFTHISIGAVVCGDCVIGDDVFIGANATVIQGVSIGSNSIIGAGSVILADVPDNMTVKGIWKGHS